MPVAPRLFQLTHRRGSAGAGAESSFLLARRRGARPARQFTPVEQRVGAVYVREKLKSDVRPSHPLAAGMPGSIVVVGGGAAGNAAAETLRHEGYSGRI